MVGLDGRPCWRVRRKRSVSSGSSPARRSSSSSGRLPSGRATTSTSTSGRARDKAWQNGNLNGNNSRYPEGGIVPFRLAIEGLAAGTPHRSTSTTTSRPAATRRTTSSRPGTSPTPRARSARRSGGGDLVDVSVAAGVVELPPSRSDPFKANGLTVARRRGLLGGAAAADDLGRHDHLDQRARSTPARPTATARPTSSSRSRRRGSAVLLAWGGHLAQSAYWDTAARRRARRRRRWCRARRGTCGRSSSTARATRTRTGASSRARSSASCRRSPSRRRRPRPRPDASAAGRAGATRRRRPAGHDRAARSRRPATRSDDAGRPTARARPGRARRSPPTAIDRDRSARGGPACSRGATCAGWS